MGRLSAITRFDAPTQVIIDRCIRAHRYQEYHKAVNELAAQGIKVARSTLHRYAVGLRERDAMTAYPEEGTVVTIVERSTGLVRVVKTSASAEALVALIEGKTRPESIS